MKAETNPVEILAMVGRENTELHEELRKVYSELDHYRNALALIRGMPFEVPAKVAGNALMLKPLNGGL